MADTGLPEGFLEYGAVLERMVDLLTADKSMKFGTALSRAMQETGVEVPEDIQASMLAVAFKVVTSGIPTETEA